MVLGEMVMGMDLEGEEPGDDSKCIVEIAYGVGLVCIYTLAGTFGREAFASEESSVVAIFARTWRRQVDRGG